MHVKTTSFATTDLYTYGNSASGEKKHQALYRAGEKRFITIFITTISTTPQQQTPHTSTSTIINNNIINKSKPLTQYLL
jgi:hypothetical protein